MDFVLGEDQLQCSTSRPIVSSGTVSGLAREAEKRREVAASVAGANGGNALQGLYGFERDPLEQSNLAESPERSAALVAFRTLLDSALTSRPLVKR